MSAQPPLELQHLERLELLECNLSYEVVQDFLQRLSSLSMLTDLQLNVEVGQVDEITADVLLAIPSLRGLRLWYSDLGADNGYDVQLA